MFVASLLSTSRALMLFTERNLLARQEPPSFEYPLVPTYDLLMTRNKRTSDYSHVTVLGKLTDNELLKCGDTCACFALPVSDDKLRMRVCVCVRACVSKSMGLLFCHEKKIM